jgi:hypothetical protein
MGEAIAELKRENAELSGLALATGVAKARYDCIKAFSATDFTEDLKKNRRAGSGDARTDDQIVP